MTEIQRESIFVLRLVLVGALLLLAAVVLAFAIDLFSRRNG